MAGDQLTNEFNELLYDEIIPRLFRQIYDLDESQQTEEHEVELIKMPANGYYEVTAAKDKIVRRGDGVIKDEERAKSFHLDAYCFDSGSENKLFWDLLREKRVKKIYFTGMLTHGQSDFFHSVHRPRLAYGTQLLSRFRVRAGRARRYREVRDRRGEG